MSWIRESVTDSNGQYDVAFVSLFGVGAATIGAIPFMCFMAWLSWLRCVPSDKVSCSFDPQPLGIAIGAAAGGFATAVAALAAYMAATRKPVASQPQTITTATATVATTGAAA